MKALALYIMQGRLQAMIAASSIALLSLKYPPVSVISSAIVALVTLRLGTLEGLYVVGCSAIAAGLLGFFILGNFQFALMYVMVLWLPVWLISIILREGRHLSLAVEIAVFLGVLGVVIIYSTVDNLTSTWTRILIQMAPANAPAENTQRTIAVLSHYMTGVVSAGSVLGLLFGLFLGRWWQAMLYNPGGFKQEFLSLVTSSRISIITLVSIGITLANLGVASEIAGNISAALLIMHLLVGVAVLHSFFATKRYGRVIVPMFYVIIILIPHALLAVVLVGLTDLWLNLRKKINLNP